MFNRIYIEITNICNLKCSFCPITTRKKEFMSVSNFEVVLSKIKNYTKHIYLHVKGEPLMHPNLDEILKLASTYDLNVNITTNARLLKDKIDILNNNKIRQINISLHSFNSVNEIKELLPNVDKLKCYVSLRLWNNKDNTEIYKLLESYYNKKIDLSSNRFSLSDRVFLSIEKLFDWPDINNEIIKYNLANSKSKGNNNSLAKKTAEVKPHVLSISRSRPWSQSDKNPDLLLLKTLGFWGVGNLVFNLCISVALKLGVPFVFQNCRLP